jgi:hypothetical protein
VVSRLPEEKEIVMNEHHSQSDALFITHRRGPSQPYDSGRDNDGTEGGGINFSKGRLTALP